MTIFFCDIILILVIKILTKHIWIIFTLFKALRFQEIETHQSNLNN